MRIRISVLYILIVSFVFVWQACDFVKVNTSDIDVSETYKPVYSISGIITNDNSQVIEDATIIINDIQLQTDDKGKYSYSSDNPLPSGTTIEVIADGFVESTAMIQYGNEAPISYFQDFILTRALPPNIINLTEGGEIDFDGIHIIVPGNNSALLDGQNLENITLGITPLSPFSTLGNWVGSTLKTLKFEPAGTEFEKAVLFIIDAPEGYSYTAINLYSFDNVSSTWEEMSNIVSYDEPSNKLTFELKVLPMGIKVADPSLITILTDSVLLEYPVHYEPNSCDCEGVFSWTGGYYFRQITITGTGIMNELNSMHFFSDYSVPYNSNLINGIFVSPAVSNVPIPACKEVDVDASRIYREITGTYIYAGEFKTFVLRYYFSNSVITSINDCPVTSNCHQGCQ